MRKTKVFLLIFAHFRVSNGDGLPANGHTNIGEGMKEYFKDVYQLGNHKKYFTNPIVNEELHRIAKTAKLVALQKDYTFHKFLKQRENDVKLVKATRCILRSSFSCAKDIRKFIRSN
ncbi:Oidioi.mRNA.OKI2018_I69.chr2.g4019.t1.cds [Oikopleura dioica]|uniref:Oidioi.mRNA.OKI2018_I69.chr2.g4019.t1.cds n=1 Tax=Oikopleura dioica TaxID=34765 RepID=A0ABN7T1I0_OIKDI|nr:Oidioi.mRNA.OKI2018_I69.chr2.g4019.t1.cds [Oikopleura dioica]